MQHNNEPKNVTYALTYNEDGNGSIPINDFEIKKFK